MAFIQIQLTGTLGSTTAAAGSTLAILVLPIVIITSAEAIRAVPQALREGGYGVGATNGKSFVIMYFLTQHLEYSPARCYL